jgi:hypothetical protein
VVLHPEYNKKNLANTAALLFLESGKGTLLREFYIHENIDLLANIAKQTLIPPVAMS